MTDADFAADFVIVGAGSTGCVLAARLSEDPAVNVILLEAGGDDRPLRNPRQLVTNMFIHMSGGFGKAMQDPRVNWFYKTEPGKDVGDRSFVMSRGKVLGGSSSINGMLYVRGQAADYDHWAQRGCSGWSYDDVLPYFRKSQRQVRGADEYHGADGTLHVSDFDERHPVSEAVISACEQAGIPRNLDSNGAVQEGAGWFQITARRGRRCSTAVAYLHAAMRRPNLKVVTGALAQRINIEDRRATSVIYRLGNELRTVHARSEVIVSAGAINSPQLLELSGIGDGERLRRLGIEVVLDRPAVGENLQDHYTTSLNYRLKAGVQSLNERSHGLRIGWEAAKYLGFGRGLLALAPAHVAIFAKSRIGLELPDIQFHALPMTIDYEVMAKKQRFAAERQPGLTLTSCALRPQSRGYVHCRSPLPSDYPEIVTNYLSAQYDQEVAVAGLEIGRKIVSQPALAALIDHETVPGQFCDGAEALLAHARKTGTTVYHPVGTCRMGIDSAAVLDPQLRVRGIAGLRVADASIMPDLISGNTNAAAIMIGEKASDLIRQKRLEARQAA